MTPLRSVVALAALCVGFAAPEPEPAAPVEPAALPPFVLSAELRADSDGAALGELRAEASGADTAPAPLIARYASRTDAIGLVERFSFETALPYQPTAIHDVPAPSPGDGLAARHGARLHAFTLVSDPPGQPWPTDPDQWLPPDTRWRTAALAVSAAPLFAAPGPRVGSAAQRHAMVDRRGDVFVLGHVDRCEPSGACLRWAQIVARDGYRFVAGYVPAFQVVARDAWVPSAQSRPRVQLVPSTVEGATASWVLWARTKEGELHRATLKAPLSDAHAWPAATVHVEADTATVTLGGTTFALPIDASLDARPEDL
jgi:hypothetical protein